MLDPVGTSDGVTLWSGKDGRGSRAIWARRTDGGGLVITGQDLGPAVEVFGPGFTEYEWTWTAEATAIPALIAALGGVPGDDPIELLKRWMAGNAGKDPGTFLKSSGVGLEFWSRLGD